MGVLLANVSICAGEGNDEPPKVLRVTWKHIVEDPGPEIPKTTAYFLDGKNIGNGGNGIKKLLEKLDELHGEKADLVIFGLPIREKHGSNIANLPDLLTKDLGKVVGFCRGMNIRVVIEPGEFLSKKEIEAASFDDDKPSK